MLLPAFREKGVGLWVTQGSSHTEKLVPALVPASTELVLASAPEDLPTLVGCCLGAVSFPIQGLGFLQNHRLPFRATLKTAGQPGRALSTCLLSHSVVGQ